MTTKLKLGMTVATPTGAKATVVVLQEDMALVALRDGTGTYLEIAQADLKGCKGRPLKTENLLRLWDQYQKALPQEDQGTPQDAPEGISEVCAEPAQVGAADIAAA